MMKCETLRLELVSNKVLCIEPFRNFWLEQLNIKIIRNKIEDINPRFFSELGENDILFIDSSHV